MQIRTFNLNCRYKFKDVYRLYIKGSKLVHFEMNLKTLTDGDSTL